MDSESLGIIAVSRLLASHAQSSPGRRSQPSQANRRSAAQAGPEGVAPNADQRNSDLPEYAGPSAEVCNGNFAVCGAPDFFQHVSNVLAPGVLPVLRQRPAGTRLSNHSNLLELWRLFPCHQLLLCHFVLQFRISFPT
jgi:hypothetical protein